MPKLEKVACLLRPSQGLSSLHSARRDPVSTRLGPVHTWVLPFPRAGLWLSPVDSSFCSPGPALGSACLRARAALGQGRQSSGPGSGTPAAQSSLGQTLNHDQHLNTAQVGVPEATKPLVTLSGKGGGCHGRAAQTGQRLRLGGPGKSWGQFELAAAYPLGPGGAQVNTCVCAHAVLLACHQHVCVSHSGTRLLRVPPMWSPQSKTEPELSWGQVSMREAAPSRTQGPGGGAAALTKPPKQLHAQGSIDKKQEHEKQTQVPYLHEERSRTRSEASAPWHPRSSPARGSNPSLLALELPWPPGLRVLPGAQGPSAALCPSLAPHALLRPGLQLLHCPGPGRPPGGSGRLQAGPASSLRDAHGGAKVHALQPERGLAWLLLRFSCQLLPSLPALLRLTPGWGAPSSHTPPGALNWPLPLFPSTCSDRQRHLTGAWPAGFPPSPTPPPPLTLGR